MKIWIFLCCFAAISHAAPGKVLTWSSSNGHSFKGSFVSKKGNTVTLKGADNKIINVPLNVLDKKSLAQLEKEHAAALKNAPVYSFENVHYRYDIYPRRDWLHLEMLRAGQPLNQNPYVFRVSMGEKIERKLHGIKITGMDGEPIVSGDEVELRLTTEKGVIIRLFASKTNSKNFSFHFSTEKSSQSQKMFTLSNTLGFPGVLKYDQQSESYKGSFSETGITFQQFPTALKDYNIDFRNGKNAKKIPYYEKQQRGARGDMVIITHPGDPVLEIDRRGDLGTIMTYFYGGRTPVEGYSIKFVAAKSEILEAGPFVIEVK